MEVGCIGFLLGALVCLVFTGIGVCFGRNDKEQHDSDSDINIYVPMRHRNRGGNKNNNPPTFEEKIMVLNTLRVGTSVFEQRVIDSIQEDIKNEWKKMDARGEDASQV